MEKKIVKEELFSKANAENKYINDTFSVYLALRKTYLKGLDGFISIAREKNDDTQINENDLKSFFNVILVMDYLKNNRINIFSLSEEERKNLQVTISNDVFNSLLSEDKKSIIDKKGIEDENTDYEFLLNVENKNLILALESLHKLFDSANIPYYIKIDADMSSSYKDSITVRSSKEDLDKTIEVINSFIEKNGEMLLTPIPFSKSIGGVVGFRGVSHGDENIYSVAYNVLIKAIDDTLAYHNIYPIDDVDRYQKMDAFSLDDAKVMLIDNFKKNLENSNLDLTNYGFFKEQSLDKEETVIKVEKPVITFEEKLEEEIPTIDVNKENQETDTLEDIPLYSSSINEEKEVNLSSITTPEPEKVQTVEETPLFEDVPLMDEEKETSIPQPQEAPIVEETPVNKEVQIDTLEDIPLYSSSINEEKDVNASSVITPEPEKVQSIEEAPLFEDVPLMDEEKKVSIPQPQEAPLVEETPVNKEMQTDTLEDIPLYSSSIKEEKDVNPSSVITPEPEKVQTVEETPLFSETPSIEATPVANDNLTTSEIDKNTDEKPLFQEDVKFPNIPEDVASNELTSDEMNSLLDDAKEREMNQNVNYERAKKYQRIASNLAFLNSTLSYNGEQITLLDYLDKVDVLSKIPLDATIEEETGRKMTGEEFIRECVIPYAMNEPVNDLNTIMSVYGAKVMKEKTGFFAKLFK